MCSTHKGKSVAERFIRTLKNKIYNYMTSTSKNVYIGYLDDKVNEYNNTYHSTIKLKPIDVTSTTYIGFGIENKEKDLKFEVGEHVRISKYKNILAKNYAPNWSKEDFLIENSEEYCSMDIFFSLTVRKLLKHFMRKNCKRQIKQHLG